MARARIGFLPAFFTVLAIVFCIALWLRIRSYTAGDAHPRSSIVERAPDASSAPPISDSHAEETTTGETKPLTRRTTRELTDQPRAVPAATSTISAATQPQPPATPSLLSRIVAPIVNAVGAASHAKATPSSSSSPTHQSQTSSSTHANPDATSKSGTNDPKEPKDPKDPTSDTQPPQLLAISFNPPQVHDGEETVLAVQASDDLSGIRSISGTIVAPSGAVQGFALQRELESDRYLARITVPKDAAEGLWRVNYLSLIDNASNATTISAAQGALPPTASFRVISSSSDATGPVLKGVWIDRPAMKAGEKNVVFVDASDEKSGVNLVSGVFLSPAKHARIGFVCRPGSGPWECELTTPACIDCGDWTLEQLQLQDKANNMTTIRNDNPLVANVRVNISSDRCDSTPPALQSLVLDRPVVSNVEDSVINVTAMASDDMCGIMSMSGQVSGPATGGGSPRLYFSFTPADAQTWVGRISVPKLAAKGTWRVTWIQVLDQGHNLKTYSQGEAPLANAVFNVQ